MLYQLYQHQTEALVALERTPTNARVVIPTGGGKTLIEAFYLRDMINKNESKDTRIHLVLAPRIILVNQLIKEYRGFIGQSYIALAFHSGRAEPDHETVKWNEKSTTSTDEIKVQFDRAKRMGKDLVVFSTYASAHKLAKFKIATVIADESQYCVTENYHETIKSLKCNNKKFFTATERHTLEGGRGLNNVSVYGPVAYQISPQTLIDRKIIVAPRLHLMYADSPDKVKSIIDEVCHVAAKQVEMTEDAMPVTKILFAMRGTDDVKTISQNWQQIKNKFPDYDIFTIVSHAKFGAQINGVKYSRGVFFNMLRETDKVLIFHYDILAEGVDIDGITGVCILRNLKQAKLLQTIGRAVRVYKANPELKKQAWVSVTAINGDQENRLFVMNVLNTLRDGGFEINAEQIDITENREPGIADDGNVDDAYDLANGRSKAKAYLDNIEHDIEETAIVARVESRSVDELIEALTI